MVVLCLGYLAVVASVYSLWRTGARGSRRRRGLVEAGPARARGELEREKKTLLKAIKEAEFDRDMGKLSKADADD